MVGSTILSDHAGQVPIHGTRVFGVSAFQCRNFPATGFGTEVPKHRARVPRELNSFSITLHKSHPRASGRGVRWKRPIIKSAPPMPCAYWVFEPKYQPEGAFRLTARFSDCSELPLGFVESGSQIYECRLKTGSTSTCTAGQNTLCAIYILIIAQNRPFIKGFVEGVRVQSCGSVIPNEVRNLLFRHIVKSRFLDSALRAPLGMTAVPGELNSF